MDETIEARPANHKKNIGKVAAVACGAALVFVGLADVGTADGNLPRTVPSAAKTYEPPQKSGPAWEAAEALPIQNLSEEQIQQLISRIEIRGDGNFKDQIIKALDLLGHKAPEYLDLVANNLGVIDYQPNDSRVELYEDKPRYVVTDSVLGAGTIWLAGSIVHDSYHSKLFNDYRELHPSIKIVPYSVYGGRNGENQCVRQQIAVLQKLGAQQSYIDYLNTVVSTEYWTTPHNDKHW